MARKTVFGTLLANFRFLKQQAIEKSTNDLWERNKIKVADRHKSEGYEIRESTVQARDGSSTTKLELWQRIDEERVKISSSITAEVLKEKDKDDWDL